MKALRWGPKIFTENRKVSQLERLCKQKGYTHSTMNKTIYLLPEGGHTATPFANREKAIAFLVTCLDIKSVKENNEQSDPVQADS